MNTWKLLVDGHVGFCSHGWPFYYNDRAEWELGCGLWSEKKGPGNCCDGPRSPAFYMFAREARSLCVVRPFPKICWARCKSEARLLESLWITEGSWQFLGKVSARRLAHWPIVACSTALWYLRSNSTGATKPVFLQCDNSVTEICRNAAHVVGPARTPPSLPRSHRPP